MLILGHTGITLGAAVVLDGALRIGEKKERLNPSPKILWARRYTFDRIAPSLTSLGNHIDIRLLLIGSLLPDIMDKPLGQFFLRDTFSNGRIFCHTLLFLTLITLAGFYLYQNRGKTWLLVLSFGTGMHLLLDQMWLEPRTLLWPLYGLAFEKLDLTHWTQGILHALLTDPTVYIPEILGAAILIWFASVLVRRKTACSFIRNGQV